MAKKKAIKKKASRKTLPKDLDSLLDAAAESEDYSAVYEALERCLPDARSRFSNETLLMNGRCTLKLARWAIDNGTKIHAKDRWGRTALHHSARSCFNFKLTPAQLIKLGADVHKTTSEGLTPLHAAVDGKNLSAVKVLIKHEADVNAKSNRRHTPLEYGLFRMSNIDLVEMVKISKTLIKAGAEISEQAKDSVKRAAENFEFHRAGFNTDYVDETSIASKALCKLFSVDPPPQRVMHDGVSPIIAKAKKPEKRFEELWELLVPSSGACDTVQGEVIRIAGKVRDEWFRNGGVNWNRQFSSMARAFTKHVSSHNALDEEDIEACKKVVRSISKDPDSCDELANWALEWVARNPDPLPLAEPSYRL